MKLNKQQRKAAHYNGNAQNILITAGAGCGKTKTIIHRVIYLIRNGVKARTILIVTFTNKAAKEIKSRIESELGSKAKNIVVGTFHSFCLQQIRRRPKSFGINGTTILDADDQKSLMEKVVNELKSKNKKLEVPFKASGLIQLYSDSRNRCQSVSTFLQQNSDLTSSEINVCKQVTSAYRKAKKERAYVDFDDLLHIYAKTLRSKPQLSAKIASQFSNVLVDEMQDTNPLQFKILKQFSSEGTKLFCVGDPAQSIYSFRGAEFEHVYEFEQKFKRSVTIRLTKNYRSNQEILDLSNWLLSNSPLDYDCKLVAAKGRFGEKPELVDFDDSYTEAKWVADIVQERQKKDIPLSEMMVLVRTGYDSKVFETEFIERQIPYEFIGGTALTRAAHVRDLLSLLRTVRNKLDDLAWIRYLKQWPKIGEKTALKIIDCFVTRNDRKSLDSIANGAAEKATNAYKLTKSLEHNTKECVEAACEAISRLCEVRYEDWDQKKQDFKLLCKVAGKYSSLSQFIDDFTLEPMTSTQLEKLEVEDAIKIITVHSAKGSESRICFVVNAKQGTYPFIKSFGCLKKEEEERRVLYVALTRAKDELFVTRASDRGGFYAENKPTKGEAYFLTSTPDDLVEKNEFGWEPMLGKTIPEFDDEY